MERAALPGENEKRPQICHAFRLLTFPLPRTLSRYMVYSMAITDHRIAAWFIGRTLPTLHGIAVQKLRLPRAHPQPRAPPGGGTPTAVFDEAETTLGFQRSCRLGPASVPQPRTHRGGHPPSVVRRVSRNKCWSQAGADCCQAGQHGEPPCAETRRTWPKPGCRLRGFLAPHFPCVPYGQRFGIGSNRASSWGPAGSFSFRVFEFSLHISASFIWK